MNRRSFLSAVGTAGAVASAPKLATAATATEPAGTIDPLVLSKACSLVAADGRPLTDDSLVAVWYEDTANNEDGDGNGDAVAYRSERIPAVASEDGVVAFGATLVDDDADYETGNEEFLLNVWDAELGGGTVLYDEGHDPETTLTNVTNFANYAGQNGYTVEATDDLAGNLDRADGAWITSPTESFSDEEVRALESFVADGGVVFVHDRADYENADGTVKLNKVLHGLSASFRFNDDQVLDETNHGGRFHQPRTEQFNDAFDYFEDRPGMEIDPHARHAVDVVDVPDGDTANVRFDSGREETVRLVGLDTPEKPRNDHHERIQEWEGVTDLDYLGEQGKESSAFGKDRLAGERVEITFPSPDEGIFDQYDRLLGLIHYDASGDGTRDDLYNLEAVEQGRARVYASGFSEFEQFYLAEKRAQSASRGLWSEATPGDVPEVRNRAVEELFVPKAVSVGTDAGTLDRSRAPVLAESTATAEGEYAGAAEVPLVGVDEDARVGVVGGLAISEDYEKAEDFAVDTAGYENFAFVANLLEHLSKPSSGPVLIEGGHGQFAADGTVNCEDTAYFQRFLEGVGIDYDGINDVTLDRLDDARAVVVSSPDSAFSSEERQAVAEFAQSGGAVILLGSAEATERATKNLNDLASGLDTDLRVGGEVTDASNNVNADETIPTTSRFNEEFDLFSAFGKSSTDTTLSENGTVTATLEDGAGNTHTYELSEPSPLSVDLSADRDTDFDLYLTEDGRTPTTSDYDHRSYNYGSDESISVDSELDGEVGIRVQSYSGSGEYTLTVEETSGGGGGGDDGSDSSDDDGGTNCEDPSWYEFWCWF